MADLKTTQLDQLAATPADNDLVMLVDVSDTTMAASGTNKRLPANYIARSDGANKLITGSGRELTVPATDTAATLAQANAFTQPQVMPAVARQINITINDDNAFSFVAPLFGMLVINSRRVQNPNISSLIAFTSAGPLCTVVAQPSNLIEVSTAVLTGTTGTDGKFIVSMNANGNIYLENRTGTTAIVSLTILGG
jgi:hypothetical protein